MAKPTVITPKAVKSEPVKAANKTDIITQLSQLSMQEIQDFILKANEEKQNRLMAELEPKKEKYEEMKDELSELLSEIRAVEPEYDFVESAVAVFAKIKKVVKTSGGKPVSLQTIADQSGLSLEEVTRLVDKNMGKGDRRTFDRNEEGEYTMKAKV